jgi:predicted nucleotidyltransferase
VTNRGADSPAPELRSLGARDGRARRRRLIALRFVLLSPRATCRNGGRATSLPADFPRRELILELARRLAAHPAVERVWLFGSRARGDHFKRSDIDLAIEAPGIDRGEWAKLHFDLDEEADTLLLIDFVLMNDLPDSFRRRVHREGRLLYERGDSARLDGELAQRTGQVR